jgi:WD40 repeat protein
MNRIPILIAAFVSVPPARAADPAFLPDVAPVLVARCASCHTGAKARGDYKLDTFESLLRPGVSGAEAVVPGKPDESELYRRLVAENPKERMPPNDDPLSAAEIAAVKGWIAAGGKFDGADRTASLKSALPPRKHPAPPEKYPTAAPVFALAFSPDGKELATGGVNEVVVWDAATGKLVRRLPRLPARVHALAYSADGAHLLVGGGTAAEYGEISLVNAKTGARVRVFGTFDDVVLAAAFSADGKTVAAGGADRTARGFAVGGKELWRASLHSDWVTGVAFSPDGKWLATASKDRTVKVLDAATGKLFTTFNGHRRQYAPHVGQFEVYAVGFDASGVALSAGGGAAIRAWEPVKTQEESGSAADMEDRFRKAGHTRYLEFPAGKPVFALALGGGRAFSAGGDGVLREHDVASGKLVREYPKHVDWVYAVAAHTGTARVATGGFDGTVRVWDTKTGDPVVSFTAAPGLGR